MSDDAGGKSALSDQLGLPPKRDVLSVVAEWALAGHITERGVTCEAGDAIRAAVAAEVASERERAALVCDDEWRIRVEAGKKHPKFSDSRDRCNAAARAARNCALGVRGGEVVGPNARLSGPQRPAQEVDDGTK